MKKRNLLAKKWNYFIKTEKKVGQEFKQRNIEKLNKKININMYSTHLRGGKAFEAEEKIRELK